MNRRALWIFLFFALVALSATSVAFATTALSLGTPTTVSFPGNSLVTNLYVDLDATAQQLDVDFTGSGGDVDMFLRYGSPFPDTANCSGSQPCISNDMIQRYAHYHSISSQSSESIIVLPSSTVPLTPGRWYITLVNGASTTASGTVNAKTLATAQLAPITLDFDNPRTDSGDASNDCDTSPWSDATAATPVGNNMGTTLGQQRKNALQYAVQELSAQLQSPVPIAVHACWAHLGGDKNRAVLAHASSTGIALSDNSFPMQWLAQKYTWYTNTQIARMGGVSNCGALGGDCGGGAGDVIEITFNSDIGSANVIGGNPFYFGLTPDPNTHSSDFVGIAMHEITHGLGFVGLANTDASAGPIGARAGITSGATSVTYQQYDQGPWDDIFDDNAVIVSDDQLNYAPFLGYELTSQPNNAKRAAALTSGNTVTSTDLGSLYAPTLLRWSDPLAVNSTVNQAVGKAPRDFPSLYAPCDLTATASCGASVGSTLSHSVQQGDLMNAFYPFPPPRTMGLAGPMLAAIGWSNAAATAPVYAQPFSGSWFDRTHGGHGIDFRLVGHDANYGDIYFLVFYTYSANGAIEWYQAQGYIVDGVFVPVILGADASTLVRMHYDPPAKRTTPIAATGGNIVIDFNQAANSPTCRNSDRSGVGLLGVMTWSFADTAGNITEQGDWCIEPITNLAQNASPDFGGLWSAAADDSGWGIAILDIDRGAAGNQLALELYYPDADGNPLWATANMGSFVSGQAIALMQNKAGFCRTCTPTAQNQVQIGTITLNFGATSTVSIQANYAGGGAFTRSNVPIVNSQVAPH
jgi:hypothetical protein